MMWIRRKPVTPLRFILSFTVAAACAAALYFGHGRYFVSLSWDPHEVNCLPDLHLALLVHHHPTAVRHGDYLFWKATSIPALSYVTDDFVLKQVAGVPGDTLEIHADKVFINGVLVVEGLENAAAYGRRPADFERREVIPPDRYFMIGTARMSNDSRYWGYLPREAVLGKGYRIY